MSVVFTSGPPADWFAGSLVLDDVPKIVRECLSTHGAAGPFVSPCPYCGAVITREEVPPNA